MSNFYNVVWKSFKKTGKVEILSIEPSNVKNYFQQQEYIKGTYIKKDRFQAILLKNVLQELADFIDMHYIRLNESILIRKFVQDELVRAVGIPEKYLGNGRKSKRSNV